MHLQVKSHDKDLAAREKALKAAEAAAAKTAAAAAVEMQRVDLALADAAAAAEAAAKRAAELDARDKEIAAREKAVGVAPDAYACCKATVPVAIVSPCTRLHDVSHMRLCGLTVLLPQTCCDPLAPLTD
jgi:hypothetical protein